MLSEHICEACGQRFQQERLLPDPQKNQGTNFQNKGLTLIYDLLNSHKKISIKTDHHTRLILTSMEPLRIKQIFTDNLNLEGATLLLISLFMQYTSTFQVYYFDRFAVIADLNSALEIYYSHGRVVVIFHVFFLVHFPSCCFLDLLEVFFHFQKRNFMKSTLIVIIKSATE